MTKKIEDLIKAQDIIRANGFSMLGEDWRISKEQWELLKHLSHIKKEEEGEDNKK